jgi:hypothetical protein
VARTSGSAGDDGDGVGVGAGAAALETGSDGEQLTEIRIPETVNPKTRRVGVSVSHGRLVFITLL